MQASKSSRAGVRCPECGSSNSRVVDTRPQLFSRQTETGSSGCIRRRRECENCGDRYTTQEYVITPPKTSLSRRTKKALIEALDKKFKPFLGENR